MTGPIFMILFGLNSVTFPCQGQITLPPDGKTIVVESGTATVKIAWTFENMITPTTTRRWTFVTKSNTLALIVGPGNVGTFDRSLVQFEIKDNATLVLKNVKHSYNGTYEFAIDDGVNPDRRSVTVFVAEKPTITICESPVTGNEDHSITCSCQGAGGNPPYPVNVTWFKNREKVEDVKRYINVLTLDNVNESDIGTYTCRAETHPLARNNKTIQVDVNLNFAPEKPTLTFSSTPAVVGQPLEITCEAKALPAPSYTIIHNGIKTVSNSSTYMIKEVGYSDGGNYTCVAKNKVGMNSTTDDLEVVGKLPSTKPTTKSTTENGTKTNEDTEVNASGTKKGLGVGAIVGIVIGVLVLLVVIIVLFWWRKNKEKERQCGNAIVNSGNNDPANAYESVNEGPKADSNTAGGNTSGNPPANANQPVVYATVDKNRKNEPSVTYATLDTMAMQPNGSKRETEPPRAQTEYASIQFEGLKGDLV